MGEAKRRKKLDPTWGKTQFPNEFKPLPPIPKDAEKWGTDRHELLRNNLKPDAGCLVFQSIGCAEFGVTIFKVDPLISIQEPEKGVFEFSTSLHYFRFFRLSKEGALPMLSEDCCWTFRIEGTTQAVLYSLLDILAKGGNSTVDFKARTRPDKFFVSPKFPDDLIVPIELVLFSQELFTNDH